MLGSGSGSRLRLGLGSGAIPGLRSRLGFGLDAFFCLLAQGGHQLVAFVHELLSRPPIARRTNDVFTEERKPIVEST